jgi:hypothetical protein
VLLMAIASWTCAALAGAYLLTHWLAGGAKVTRLPATLVVTHPLLAVAGLACWIAFLLTQSRALAWAALGAIAATAFFGFVMLTRWLGSGRHGGRTRFPVLAVVLHGLAGVVTFVLVLLSVSRVLAH